MTLTGCMLGWHRQFHRQAEDMIFQDNYAEKRSDACWWGFLALNVESSWHKRFQSINIGNVLKEKHTKNTESLFVCYLNPVAATCLSNIC